LLHLFQLLSIRVSSRGVLPRLGGGAGVFFLLSLFFSFCYFFAGAMESTRALNRETLYAASKDLEHAAKNRGKPPKKEKKAPAPVVVEESSEKKKKNEEETAAALKTKVDKKRKSSSSPNESGPSSNGIKAAVQPRSLEKEPSKKIKKIKAVTAAAEEPVSVPIAEQPVSGGKKIKKKSKKSEAVIEAAGGDVTPIVSPNAAALVGAADARRRKNVRFSLKRNLVMTIGQPPLPEDIRTPPTSKPKGSALKVKVNVHRHVGSALGKPAAAKRLLIEGPSSAPPKYTLSNNTAHGSRSRNGQGNGKGRSPVGTRSVAKGKAPGAANGTRRSGGGGGGKRPRASDFF